MLSKTSKAIATNTSVATAFTMLPLFEGNTALRYYCATRQSPQSVNNSNSNSNKKNKIKNKTKPIVAPTLPPLPPLFDVDTNLTHQLLRPHVEDVLAEAHAAGVRAALVPGTSLAESTMAIDLANMHRATVPVRLFCSVGVHPYCVQPDADEHEASMGLDARRARLKELALLHRHDTGGGSVVAIGECGLDYSPGFPPKDAQLPVFRMQVELACDLQLPLFLHERAAHADFLDVIDDVFHRHAADGMGAVAQQQQQQQRGTLPRVLVHCFTGTRDELRTYMDRGYWVSVSGLVCKSEEFATELRHGGLRLNRVMVETDAPYMGFDGCRANCANKQRRSHPNVPSALPLVVMRLAQVMGVDPQELAEESTANACEFFGVNP